MATGAGMVCAGWEMDASGLNIPTSTSHLSSLRSSRTTAGAPALSMPSDNGGALSRWQHAGRAVELSLMPTRIVSLLTKPPLWEMAPTVELSAAAHDFDQRYRSASFQLERLFHRLSRGTSSGGGARGGGAHGGGARGGGARGGGGTNASGELEHAYREALEEVFRARFFAPERAATVDDDVRAGRARRRPAHPPQPFDPYSSFWGARARWSDGHDLYDHVGVKFRRFEADWKRLLLLGISQLVLRWDDDALVDEDRGERRTQRERHAQRERGSAREGLLGGLLHRSSRR